MHGWHRDRAGHVLLDSHLQKEVHPGEQYDPSVGKSDIRGLTAQCIHLGCSAGRSDGKQESDFPGQVFEQTGYRLKSGLDEGCQDQLQTPAGVIKWRMPLECSRPLTHLSIVSILRGLPWTIAYLHEIAVTYPFMVFTASVTDWACKKSRICFRGVRMGF